MPENRNKLHLSQLLKYLADEIDVPAGKYQEAKDHYAAVGDWLNADDSDLAPFKPVIHPQGSFALGTAIRPLGEDHYDVDAVCLLTNLVRTLTQQQLKAIVGARLLQPKSRYKDMIDPREGGTRCWTIRYADESKFHLDILPAIPDDYQWLVALGVPLEWAMTAIRVTDRKKWAIDPEWPRSNPKGFLAWFKDRMRVRLLEARAALAMEKRAEVQDIQDYEVRTPLQRLVQLLKRHRDQRYNGDEDKPISVIISTLAARAYNNEADIVDALLQVVPRMRLFIEKRRNVQGQEVWWVANPVNPAENFADKWAAKPRKAELFFEWLTAVEKEHAELMTDRGFEKVANYLTESYGDRDARSALATFANRRSVSGAAALASPIILVPSKAAPAVAPRIDVPATSSKPWKL